MSDFSYDIGDYGNGSTNTWDDVLKGVVTVGAGAIANAISGQQRTPVPAAAAPVAAGGSMTAYMPFIVMGGIVLGAVLLLKKG